jgi:hypothetical protein
MTDFQHLIYELEDYARQNGGRFWLADVPSRTSPPPSQLWVVVDFDDGSIPATVFVEIVCKKHGIRFLVFEAANMDGFVREQMLPNALVLGGAPYDSQGNRLGGTAYFRKRYPRLISADINFEIRNGWVSVLDDYLREVSEIIGDQDIFELRGVQQKYGMLDVFWRGAMAASSDADDRILAAGIQARERSERTCEICGQPGSLRMAEGGRIYTACDIHGADDERIERVSGHE